MRAFFAVDLKSPQVVGGIVDMQNKLLATGADLKPVSPNNLHFTIKFLGEINDLQFERICERLNDFVYNAISTMYVGIGVFPDFSRISVIWIGVDRESGMRLVELARLVDEKVASIAPGDAKKFQPHLTISRVKTGRNKDDLIRVVKEYSNHIFGEDVLNALKLKKSDLTPRGPIYTDLMTIPFKEV